MVSKLIFIVAIIGVIFGIWGIYTDSGRRIFDEMDGIIPFFVLFISIGFIIIIIIYKSYRLLYSRRL